MKQNESRQVADLMRQKRALEREILEQKQKLSEAVQLQQDHAQKPQVGGWLESLLYPVRVYCYCKHAHARQGIGILFLPVTGEKKTTTIMLKVSYEKKQLSVT